jgi:hypothetical protein
MAIEYDPEKHIEEKTSDTSSEVPRDNGNVYAREELLDPDEKDETLHRGLSARQISMIAVRSFLYDVGMRHTDKAIILEAWRCSWYRPYHWLRYGSRTWRSSGYLLGI